MERDEIIIGLVSSITGGLLVAILNILFTRKKTLLEAKKLELEIEKLRAETGRLQGDFIKLNATVREATSQSPVHRISFDYLGSDSPENNGWKVVERIIDAEPEFTLIKDGFRGRVLQIRRRNRYAMDYTLNPSTGMGSFIEYVVRLEEDGARVYAQVIVQSRDSSQTEKLWLAFKAGTGRPKEWYGLDPTEAKWEWSVPVAPKRLNGKWQRFQIDLRDVVRRCLEDEGWQFAGQIITFRLRGNLSIAYISIFD